MAEKAARKLIEYNSVPDGGQLYRREMTVVAAVKRPDGSEVAPVVEPQFVYARPYDGAEGFSLRVHPWRARSGEEVAPLIPHPEDDPDKGEVRMVPSITTGGGRGDWVCRDLETGEHFVVRSKDFPKQFRRVSAKSLPPPLQTALQKRSAASAMED